MLKCPTSMLLFFEWLQERGNVISYLLQFHCSECPLFATNENFSSIVYRPIKWRYCFCVNLLPFNASPPLIRKIASNISETRRSALILENAFWKTNLILYSLLDYKNKCPHILSVRAHTRTHMYVCLSVWSSLPRKVLKM